MVDSGELAGIVTVVARHGKIVQFETFGMQDKEAGIPMAKDTIMRIYSMTKPIAGVALMTLYDQGKFKLEDPVEKYIPELANLKVAKADGPDGNPVVEEPTHKMTIRELVSHTGGLTYGFFSRSQVDTLYQKANILDRNSTLQEFVTKLGKIPLRQQPGTLWHYSVSVDVQGYLVEVLSGKPFDQYLEETHLQAPRHEGHRVLGAGSESRAPLAALRAGQGRQAGEPGQGRVPHPGEVLLGRWRPDLDRDGLHAASRRCCSTAASSTACGS